MSADNWTTCPRCDPNGDEDEKSSFREDYEFYGAESGTISWDYSGYCRECELQVTFTGERKFFP